MSAWNRAALEALDRDDPLAGFRDQFYLREGLVYLDGNSLGALPRRTMPRLEQVAAQEWGEGLITSWLGAEWITAPRRVGDKIARLLGAEPGEVIVADSTSINLFKALTAALSLRPDRSVILSETGNFPTDLYMMQGISAFSGGRVRAEAVAGEEVLERLGDAVAVLLLTQVHYKTGVVRDMAEVTRRAHEAGVLVVWDLSHSAGAIPVDLNGAGADFAVGCGYKFLNGGPGAPAYIFAAGRHQAAAMPVLSGWMGHAAPFAFEDGYRAADGIERFLCGTPPILSMAALECGVDLMAEADMAAVRAKSLQLGRVFMDLMDEHCGAFGFALVSPREDARRGSHVSYAHPHSYGMMQALKERGVIGDFRDPDVLRFGLTPLTLRHADMLEAVLKIRDVCETQAWDDPRWAVRAAVT